MAGALHRSTFATREVDDDDDVRVDFSIFDRKKKIRYTLVVKTDVFFFDKTVVFSNSHFTTTKQKKNSSKVLQKTIPALCREERAVAKSTNAMAAAKRSAKSAKTKKPSPLTSTNAKISAFLSDYVATSNGNAFASGLKLLVKKTSSKKKNNKADARDENDDQNFFLDGKRVLGLSDAIAKVRFPRLRGRDGVSPRGLRRSVFSSFFSNGVVFRKKRRNENFGLSKPLTKFFLDTDRRWKISTTKASRTTAVDRTRTSFCSTLKK